MPYLLKRTSDGLFVRPPGSAYSYTSDRMLARAYSTREAAEADACGDEVVVDNVRAGRYRPCAIHKGPAGNCQPWNCTCY